MHCKACNKRLREKDYFILPSGEENNLCSKCLEIINNIDKVDLDNFTYEVRALVYDD